VSAPWSWRANDETHRSCTRHSVHQLLNSAFVGLTWVFYLKLLCSWMTSCNFLEEYQSWRGTWCVLFRLGVEEIIEGSQNNDPWSGVCLVCPFPEPRFSGQVFVSWACHCKVTSCVSPRYSLFKTLHWRGYLDASLGLRKGYCGALSPFSVTRHDPTVLWLSNMDVKIDCPTLITILPAVWTGSWSPGAYREYEHGVPLAPTCDGDRVSL